MNLYFLSSKTRFFLQSSRGYCAVESLASMELDSEHGWLDMLVQQLKVRDSILNDVTQNMEKLRKSGAGLEMDVDYLQLKVPYL